MTAIRSVRLVLAAAVLAALVAYSPLPASACSCAAPGDLVEWVGDSEAVFVGSLVEKRPSRVDPIAGEAIYVFEVETWVKGDLGDVIEVHSAADGAGCGFEFFTEGMRTASAIRLHEGRLSGGLCDQVDPDVLLSALSGAKPSETGVPRMLVGGGWSSDRMYLLDAQGGLVAELHPPEGDDPFTGTIQLAACPGNQAAVQLTTTSIHIWDTTTGALVATHGVVGAGEAKWVAGVSCGSADGSDVVAIVQDESSATLLNVITREELATLHGESWKFGPGFLIALEKGANGLARVDLDTGEIEPVYATGEDVGHAGEFAIHAGDGRIALLETRFSDTGSTARLLILTSDGELLTEFGIGAEAYQPSWLSDDRVAVQAYDAGGEHPSLLVFDVVSGERVTFDGLQADYLQAEGDSLYATSGGDIYRAELDSGTTELLTTLPVQSSGPLILLPGDLEPVTTTTSIGPTASEPTVPPLVEGEIPGQSEAAVAPHIVARAVVIVVIAALLLAAWLGRRRSIA